jgi:NTE family protein
MFGAWQAGAWLALEKAFQPDLVVGASVGALNGWMIASRCAAAEMADHWRSPMFGGNGKGRPADDGFPLPGLVSGRPVLNIARQLTETFQPQTPLALVCTEFPALRARIFRDGELTPDHLYASCAVPIILPARRLPDGRVYGDGGFLGPLPLWAAAELGATRILAIHVLPPMPFWLGWKIRTMQIIARHDDSVPTGVKVIRVGPRRTLGGFRDSAVWDAGNVERWLEEGNEVGERAAHDLMRQ